MASATTRSSGGSGKTLLVVATVVAVAAGGGWFALRGHRSVPAALLAEPVAELTKPAAPLPHSVAPAVEHHPNVSEGATTAIAAAPTRTATPATDSIKSTAAARHKSAAADSAARLEVNLSAPTIPGSVELDAVTRGIEQATKAKVDSAQKPRLDVKAPIFKKP